MGKDTSDKPKRSTGKSLFSNDIVSPGEAWDWSAEDAGRLRDLITTVTTRGGAIRFGYSRDGKAGSIGIYYGDSRDTLWLRPGGDSEAVYQRIETTFLNLPNTNGASPD